MTRLDYCAIDFGTSNSAIALPSESGIRLVELEPGFHSIPTAVFYNAEDETRCFGRDAVAAYVDGFDGRLMRSIKSILGSDLMEQSTEIGHGSRISYLDVVIGYLKHLKRMGELQSSGVLPQQDESLRRVIIGRPVWFVDGDKVRDRKAEASLETAAQAAGFAEVAFQLEPIAAALDYESTIDKEQIALIADIGGGTSDFSLVRVGPARHARIERHDDILANHGVHVAGTDFDQAVNLAAIMPELGYGSHGPAGRRVPGKVYFDLATWHLINTVYGHQRISELREMISMYGDTVRYRRLMAVVEKHLGHELAARAEQAKIQVALHGNACISLDSVEAALEIAFSDKQLADALNHKVQRIVQAAAETLHQAGVLPEQVGVVYFTGGSTGFQFLTARIAAQFPHAQRVAGDRFSSVANGLGIYAQRRFGM